MHCVDLGESFPTRIYLQKSASIQPRTSPSKSGQKFNSLFTSLLSREPSHEKNLCSLPCSLAPVIFAESAPRKELSPQSGLERGHENRREGHRKMKINYTCAAGNYNIAARKAENEKIVPTLKKNLQIYFALVDFHEFYENSTMAKWISEVLLRLLY